VFVPARWWHAARALSTSISVCSNMLDESNWDGFVSEVVRMAQLPPRRIKLLHLRLRATGAVLTALENFQKRLPTLAAALILPCLIAPLTAERAPEPSRRQLNIRIPTA
jgi:hypothetical protein